MTGFISKTGRPFGAVLKLDNDFKLVFDFGDAAENSGEELDLSQYPVVGKCPKCGGRLLEAPTSYICENTAGMRTCDFRCGRIILQQPVDKVQLEKILTEGKSDLLNGFVSNRNGRKFKAYLVLDKKTGKIGFEFQQRETDAAATKAKKPTVRHTVAKKTTA